MTLEAIQTELCSSGIGRVSSQISLMQLAAQLQTTRPPPGPGPVTLLTNLEGYWNGAYPTADYGAMQAWESPGGDVSWGAGTGPNGFGGSFYQALNGSGGGTGGLGVENNDSIVQQMNVGKTTVMVWAATISPEYELGLVDIINKAEYQGSGLILTPNMVYELYHSAQDGDCNATNDYYFPVSFNGTYNWNQFVMVNGPEAGDKKVYVNGAYIGASPTVGFCPSNTWPLRIQGRYWELPLNFALMGFWTRELDATEIATLYNGGLGLSASEL